MSLTTTTTVYKDDVHVVPAADLNSWRTDMPKALDGCAGGSYSPSSAINVAGSGFGSVEVRTACEVNVGGQWVEALGTTITDVDGQELTVAQGQVREFAQPTAQRDHELSTTGAVKGSWIHFTRPAAGAFAIILHRVGSAPAIVSLAAGWCGATVYFDGTNWRLLCLSGGSVAGGEA